MSPCTGHPKHVGCAHPGALQRGIHWPHCIDRNCEGCMPILSLSLADLMPGPDPGPQLDLSIFRKDV